MNTKLLEQMVKIESIYPSEYRLGKFMCAYLARHGFRVKTQKVGENRYNILATRGRGGKAVLFYGHLDTVPITHIKDWKTDPYVLTNKSGKLYGLGAYDMKSGIACFLDAAIGSDGYIKIFLAVDEEYLSEGAWEALAHRRGFFSDVSLIISAEPNFGMGLHGILRGRTGRYIFTVDFEGVPAHVARHAEGRDAVEMLGVFIADFYRERDRLFISHGSFAQIRAIEGEAIGMSVCGNTRAQIEVLANHTDTIEGVRERLQSLTAHPVRIKARKTPYLPGYYFKLFPYQEIISDVICRTTGKHMELNTRISVGDDNAMSTLGIPVISWGPDGGNAHAPNEYVTLKSMETLSQMFREVINKIAIEDVRQM